MRLRIHHALFAGFLGVVGLLVVLIVVLVGSGLRRELVETFRAELARHLALGDALLSSSSSIDADSLARAITGRIGYRVTIIDLDGTVLGDSFVDPADLADVENHGGRPEVRGAMDNDRVSFAERRSDTTGVLQLYGAALTSLDGVPVVLRIAAPQTAISATVRGVQGRIAATGFVAMLVALVAAYALSRAFARPLIVLADRARRLSEGDFTANVPHARVVELEHVSIAFNRLADLLQARLAELVRERDEMQTLIDCMAEGVVALTEDGRVMRTNRAARALLGLPDGERPAPIGSVVRDPDLRRALEESLTRAAQSQEIRLGARHVLLASRALDLGGAVTTLLDITELRRLEKVRRDFVANASHELKTPLTAIRGFAETLVDDDPPPDLRKRFLTSIHDNTLRLQRLVDDLLDLSRLESGGWTAKTERVAIGEVVAEAWDLVSAQMTKSLDFALEGDGTAFGDRQGLVQVLRNLFENSIRHTEEGGHIRVMVGTVDEGRAVEIAVEDDGEGIPSRVLPRVFERFYRADSSRARDIGGTGLGLAIVKHLVGAMGGEVRAESEVARGTTIRISLPAA